MCVNSTPGDARSRSRTRWVGISGGGYASRVVRTRSPSSVAQSGTRGREPVATTNTSPDTSVVPVVAVDRDVCESAKRAVPRTSRTPCDSSRLAHRRRAAAPRSRATRCAQRGDVELAARGEAHRGAAVELRRARRRWRSSPSTGCSPTGGRRRRSTSRSTSVTSAPSVAATVAAVLPAGPATDDHESSAHGPKLTRRRSGPRAVPEYRHDAILDRRVIVAADRAARPYTTAEGARPPRRRPDTCPFCPGHEHETPPETCRPGDGEPGHAGLAGPGRPEPLPHRRRAGGRRRDRRARGGDPLPRSRPRLRRARRRPGDRAVPRAARPRALPPRRRARVRERRS